MNNLTGIHAHAAAMEAACKLGDEANADRAVGLHPLDVLVVPHALLNR